MVRINKKEAVARATEKDLRGFVEMIVAENEEVAEKFYQWMQDSLSEKQLESYKEEVTAVIAECFDLFRQAREEKRKAPYKSSKPWEEYIERKVKALTRREQMKYAFILVNHGWMLINYEEEKVRTGGGEPDPEFAKFISYMDNCCNSSISRILENNPPADVRDNIFALLCSVAETRTRYPIYDGGNKYPLCMFEWGYQGARFRKPLLEFLINLAETRDEKVLETLFYLLDLPGSPEEEGVKWKSVYSDTHAYARYRSQKAADLNNYGTAGEILFYYYREHCMEPEEAYRYGVEDLHTVIWYAKQAKDSDLLRNAYMELLKRPDVCLNEYLNYRKLFSRPAWVEERDHVYAVANEGLKNGILYEEGNYKLLLDRLLKTATLDEMDLYADTLIKIYPDEISRWYGGEIRKIAEKGDISSCRKAVRCLYRISGCSAGMDIASKILAEWRKKYPDRKNLWKAVEEEGFGLRRGRY